MKISAFCIGCFFSLAGHSQIPALKLFDNADFKKSNNHILSHPYDGGYNAPIFSEADLNGDDIQDLVVFDKSTNAFYTYLNNGTAGQIDYTFHPEYQENFPEVADLALLHDFNCDGIADLFAYNNPGLRCWLGSYNVQNELVFTPFKKLTYPHSSGFELNIYVDRLNLPALEDIDGDSDMDLLVFDQFGATIEWYKNQSAEDGFGCDSLIFKYKGNCFGKVCECESGTNTIRLDYFPTAICVSYNVRVDSTQPPGKRHMGATLTAFDREKDNDIDLFIGDPGFDNIVMLLNGQVNPDSMVYQDTTFPKYNVPVDLPVFPAVYFIDINNDRDKDMLAAPFTANNCALSGLNDTASNVFNTWAYFNHPVNDTLTLFLQSESFITSETLDEGERVKPVFFDYNSDGLLDIVIGRCYKYSNHGLHRGMALYENTGTAAHPVFEFVMDNYLQLDTLQLTRMAPAFGDMDGDGDQDLIIAAGSGDLVYLKNTAPTGQPAKFDLISLKYLGINKGESAAVQIVDVNEDKLPDLIVGERNGNLNYFENVGTAQVAAFSLVSEFWGEVDVRMTVPWGYSSPWLEKMNGQFYLAVGSARGRVYFYTNIENNLNGKFDLVDSTTLSPYLDGYVAPAAGYLTNGIYPEWLVGSERGGFSLYTIDKSIGAETSDISTFSVHPLPADDQLVVTNQGHLFSLDVYDLSGIRVFGQKDIQNSTTINVSAWPAGMYMMKVDEVNGASATRKFVIVH